MNDTAKQQRSDYLRRLCFDADSHTPCSRIDISLLAHDMSQACATTYIVQIVLRPCCGMRAHPSSFRARLSPIPHATKKQNKTNIVGCSMGYQVRRACVDCRQLTTSTRCDRCQRLYKERYQGGWARHSRAQRHAEPLCDWCGSTEDLTADHLVAGKIEYGIRTLCRPCNSRRVAGGGGIRGG